MQEYSKKELMRRRKLRRLKRRIKRAVFVLISLTLLILLIFLSVKLVRSVGSAVSSGRGAAEQKNEGSLLSRFNFEQITVPEYVDVQLLTNPFARKGKKLDRINGIVIHYVGNPDTSAQNNRDYFNQPSTTVCSHFVVGLEGEIIQCVPLDERSAASNDRNRDTFSIEVCHPDESGKFNDATYESLKKLTAWLCETFELDTDKVIRHYDVTGKICPKYYVENTEEWTKFTEDVKAILEQEN